MKQLPLLIKCPFCGKEGSIIPAGHLSVGLNVPDDYWTQRCPSCNEESQLQLFAKCSLGDSYTIFTEAILIPNEGGSQ